MRSNIFIISLASVFALNISASQTEERLLDEILFEAEELGFSDSDLDDLEYVLETAIEEQDIDLIDEYLFNKKPGKKMAVILGVSPEKRKKVGKALKGKVAKVVEEVKERKKKKAKIMKAKKEEVVEKLKKAKKIVHKVKKHGKKKFEEGKVKIKESIGKLKKHGKKRIKAGKAKIKEIVEKIKEHKKNKGMKDK